MRPLLFFAAIHLSIITNLHAQVLLTEVMFDPAGNENYDEFLEIYNSSATDTIDLQGWRIGDQNETDLFVSLDLNFALAPRHYAIILDAGYFANSGIYDAFIPPEALILTINDAAFGSGGLSNANAETVVLISSAGDTIAHYQYSLGNPPGYSDEKKLLSADDTFGNWGDARRFNGTPGSRNSLTPADNDLALGAIQFSPPKPERGQAIQFRFPVYNVGIFASSEAMIRVTLVSNRGTVVLDSLPLSPLAPADSLVLESRWMNVPAGVHRVVFFLSNQADENPTNDSAIVDLEVRWPSEIVRINEIMFAPASGQAEWVEIFNPTDENISVAGWRLQDESGKTAVLSDAISIAGQGYFVIGAANSVREFYQLPDTVFAAANGFPTLNNEGDLIRLLDFSGAVIDSLFYDGDWSGSTGISLEKVWHERANEAGNWLPSLAAIGATPGHFNSRSPRSVDVEARALLIAPAKPHAGENVRLLATAYNSGRHAISSLAVVFYLDADGDGIFLGAEKIGEVLSSAVLQSEDSLTLSHDLAGQASGRFTVAAIWEISGDANVANDSSFATLLVGYPARNVVINEIQYDPQDDDSEWIELFNRSNRVVDLRGWEFSDSGTTITIADTVSNFLLPPGEFLLLTGKDQSWSARPLVVSGFPTLNNDDDKLTLRDFSGTVQDSVHYLADWGGGEGISLERINPELTSNEAGNWSGCVDRKGSTPGAANSIYAAIVPQQATISVTPNPFSPDGDGQDDFAIIQFHLPVTTAAVHLKIYDLRGRLVRHLLNNAPTGASYQVVWNGAGENGEALRMGIYVVFVQALNEKLGVVREARTTVVLAKRL